MMMRAQALLQTQSASRPTSEIRAALEPNLCRCGTHMRILRAVRRAAQADGHRRCSRRRERSSPMNAATSISLAAAVLAGGGALIVSFSLPGALRAAASRARRRRPAAGACRAACAIRPCSMPGSGSTPKAASPSSPARPSSGRASRPRFIQIAAEELDVAPRAHPAGHRGHRADRRTRAIPPAAIRWRTAAPPSAMPPRRCATLLIAEAATRLRSAGRAAARTRAAPSIARRRHAALSYGELVTGPICCMCRRSRSRS